MTAENVDCFFLRLFNFFFNKLLSSDSYIARNDYNSFINQDSTEIEYLKKLHNDKLLLLLVNGQVEVN